MWFPATRVKPHRSPGFLAGVCLTAVKRVAADDRAKAADLTNRAGLIISGSQKETTTPG
jgi:hypothetical protein